MNISKALKEKNVILNTMKKAKDKITEYNQVNKGDERPFDIEELVATTVSASEELVKIKTAIHVASAPVREKIFTQSELKDRIKFLKGINCKTGTINERYGGTAFEVESVLNAKMIDEKVTALETEIVEIQDELDKFNFSTEISL